MRLGTLASQRGQPRSSEIRGRKPAFAKLTPSASSHRICRPGLMAARESPPQEPPRRETSRFSARASQYTREDQKPLRSEISGFTNYVNGLSPGEVGETHSNWRISSRAAKAVESVNPWNMASAVIDLPGTLAQPNHPALGEVFPDGTHSGASAMPRRKHPDDGERRPGQTVIDRRRARSSASPVTCLKTDPSSVCFSGCSTTPTWTENRLLRSYPS